MAGENTRSTMIRDAGQRVARDLNGLEQRTRNAMDWRIRYTRHMRIFLAAAVRAGVLLGRAMA
jgi:hypothetical protein